MGSQRQQPLGLTLIASEYHLPRIPDPGSRMV